MNRVMRCKSALIARRPSLERIASVFRIGLMELL